MGACDPALWFQVEPHPDEDPPVVPTEEDAVQACEVVPTQYGNGVETVPFIFTPPAGHCLALAMPKGTKPADMLAALATVMGSEEGGSASLQVADHDVPELVPLVTSLCLRVCLSCLSVCLRMYVVCLCGRRA